MISSAAAASDWGVLRVDGATGLGNAELRFGEDGSLSGTTGCNQFTGQGIYSGDILTISKPLATTRMACVDPAIDLQEQTLLALLQGTVSVAYDPYLEQVNLSANDHTAMLEPVSSGSADGTPPVFEAGTVVVSGISSRLNLRSEPTTSSEVVARLPIRSTNTNLGCERKEDRDWCRLSLESGVAGWAAAEFLSPLTLGVRAKAGTQDRIGRLTCSGQDGENAGLCEYGSAIEGDHAIVSVFVDDGIPAVLHFRSGVFDPMASFGPFAAAEGETQPLENGVRINFQGYWLEVPTTAVQP